MRVLAAPSIAAIVVVVPCFAELRYLLFRFFLGGVGLTISWHLINRYYYCVATFQIIGLIYFDSTRFSDNFLKRFQITS